MQIEVAGIFVQRIDNHVPGANVSCRVGAPLYGIGKQSSTLSLAVGPLVES